jgi:predicted acetyltransferase
MKFKKEAYYKTMSSFTKTMFVDITEHTVSVYHALSQPYEAEFSPLTGTLPDPQGRYPISTPIDNQHKGVLCYDDSVPVGFAIVQCMEGQLEVKEFYIIPTHRGRGLGQKMAQYLFDRFQGSWEVKQLPQAKAATAFWRNVIDEYTHGQYSEEMHVDTKWGNVIRQTFHASEAFSGNRL